MRQGGHRRPGPSSAFRSSATEAEEEGLLVELRALYDQADASFSGWSCDASTDCCRFGVTGREPYPTPIELRELERAIRARGGLPKRRTLPVAEQRRCDLLSDEGRCLVYASRPFGCLTFFCERATAPAASKREARSARDEILRLGREVAALADRFAPSDPGPRPLSRWTATFAGDRAAKTKMR